MARNKKESFFWTSYSDLMTSLFFVMLVLFVLVIVLLKSNLKVTQDKLERIKEVVNSTKDMNPKYFEYNDDYKKFILKVNCQFEVNSHDINALPADNRKALEETGKELQKFLEDHNTNQYLVLIEGQASKNSEAWTNHNYELSFLRAYSLRQYWEKKGIVFGNNCEIQIAGSGDGRLNANTMRESKNEVLNQRFLIYVLPKNIIPDDDEKKEEKK